MELVIVGNYSIGHLCPAGVDGLSVAGDFRSCVVLHVHCGIGLLLADYFGHHLLAVDIYPCSFCTCGRVPSGWGIHTRVVAWFL